MPLSKFQPERYQSLLDAKIALNLAAFKPFCQGEPDIFASPAEHYRMRAEFRLWHEGNTVNYVMFRPEEPKTPHVIETFPVAARPISDRLAPLRDALNADATLRQRCFMVEFLTTSSGETMLTLVYHRKLDEQWLAAAKALAQTLDVKIIGRSRKQKLVPGDDFVTENLTLGERQYQYRQADGVFTQPNATVNSAMISWVMSQVGQRDDDLLELYCGMGNFTMPLSACFRKVLATEIAKVSVNCARHNAEVNGVDNLTLLRMSSEEFTQAIDKVRPFRRLKDVDLDAFELGTVLVDPPRAGLDDGTLALVSRLQQIVYISCNPTTLVRNLETLSATHSVQKLAFFDQFPYTDHLECGVILTRK